MLHVYTEEEIELVMVRTNHFINVHHLNYNKAIKRIVCKGTINKSIIDDYKNFKNCDFFEYIEFLSNFDKNNKYQELISVHNDFHQYISDILSRHLTFKPISENLFNNLYFAHSTLVNLLNDIIMKFDFAKNQLDKATNAWMKDIFKKFIEREYLGLKSGKKNFCLVYFNIDDFRNITDNYAHDVCGFVLKELINVLKSYLREYDSISRWRSDEFLILLPETDLSEALDIVNKIKDIISQKKFIYKQEEIKLTCSFGISLSNLEKNIETTIDESEKLLYVARKNGKNRVEVQK